MIEGSYRYILQCTWDSLACCLFFIEVEMNIEEIDKNEGYTPLQWSCIRGYHDSTRLLLDNGACMHANGEMNTHRGFKPNQTWYTPLALSLLYGHDHIALYLISRGADVNVDIKTQREGRISILHLAAWKSSHEVVNKVIAKSPDDIDRITENNMTPLHYAVIRGNVDVVRTLIDNSAGIFTTDENENNIMHLACMHGHIEILNILLALFVDTEPINIDGRSPLAVAAQGGHIHIVDRLLKHKVDHQTYDHNRMTPLMLLSRSRSTPQALQIATLLTDAGTDPNAVDKDGYSALYWACDRNLPLASFLHTRGASIKIKDRKEGWGPLHVASMTGSVDVVSWIISLDHHVNLLDNLNNTPLHYACKYGRTDVVSRLLANGAKQMGNEDGEFPMHISAGAGSSEQVQLLYHQGGQLELGPNEMTVLHYAASSGIISTIQLVLKLMSHNFYCDNTHNTLKQSPLHMASMGNRDDRSIADLFIKYGCNYNAADTNGDTPLCLSVRNNNLLIATTLIKHGADVNVACEFNETPLHLAAMNANPEMVFLLLSYDADPHAQGKNGNTPILNTYARASQDDRHDTRIVVPHLRVEVVKILLAAGANVNYCNRSNRSLLEESLGHLVTARGLTAKLLIQGADVNGCSNIPPLMIAVGLGDIGVVETILNWNPDVNKMSTITYFEYNATTQAVLLGHLEIATLLMKEPHGGLLILPNMELIKENSKESVEFILGTLKKDQKKIEEFAATHLATAAMHGDTETVKLLVAYVKDKNIVNDALYKSIQRGNINTCEVLISSGGDIYSNTLFILSTVTRNHHKLLRLFTDESINSFEEDGCKLLTHASVQGNLETVMALLPRCDTNHINHANSTMGTPLQIACEKGNVEIAKAIIRYAEPNAVSNERTVKNHPPLTLAVLNDDITLVKAIAYNVHVDHRSEVDGSTALHWAVEDSNLPMVKLLLSLRAHANIKDNDGKTALDMVDTTTNKNSKEKKSIIELLHKSCYE
eukprot:GHVR01029366.1.p1 GENE.GHVR01029366.1~~GHVR01029366.1.p1  ORF type:complete len:994 (+),score=171.20 GHVR01029366.1:1139-4120(+)